MQSNAMPFQPTQNFADLNPDEVDFKQMAPDQLTNLINQLTLNSGVQLSGD